MSSLRARRIARNPFAFPGGMPVLNSSHPIANGMANGRGFLGVAAAGGFVSLVSGSPGTLVNTPTFGVQGILGPAVHFTAGNQRISFGGQRAVTDLAGTFVAICSIDSLGGVNRSIIWNDSSTGPGTGIGIRVSTGGFLAFTASTVLQATSTLAVAANTPYFMAASCSGASGTVNFVLGNLQTGSILTNSQTAPASSAGGDVTYTIGNDSGSANSLNGWLAMTGFMPTRFFSAPQLAAFAAAPWTPVYPQ